MKMSSTVSGMATAMVGSSDTRMRNQPIQMNSRHSNGCLRALPVRMHIRKNPPATSVPGRILSSILPPTTFEVVIGAAPEVTPLGASQPQHVSPSTSS